MSEIDEETVERVARAMRRRWIDLLGNTPSDVTDDPSGFEIAIARAAIAAMREPTAAMIRAIPEACPFPYKGECGKQAWQSMIDEALK